MKSIKGRWAEVPHDTKMVNEQIVSFWVFPGGETTTSRYKAIDWANKIDNWYFCYKKRNRNKKSLLDKTFDESIIK